MLALYFVGWTGCSSAHNAGSALSKVQFEANEGYSLLYQLVGKQKDVDKLLLIKGEESDVRILIKEIAAACGGTFEQLETFAAQDSRLDLKLNSLPAVEKKTRDSIASERAKKLIFSGGMKFELQLLLSQAEGLCYGAHLASVLSSMEEQTNRKAYLEVANKTFEDLYKRVVELLASRYAEDKK